MPSPQPHSVASELLVKDSILVVPAPPLSIATVGDVVWIAFSDGKVEVRNSRTGEVVRRFEPAISAVPTSALTGSAAIGVGGSTGMLALLKQHSSENAATTHTTNSATIVCALLAVPTVDGDTHVWMGLSNGCIEVHDGSTFSSSSGETAVNMSNRPSPHGLIALLRKHTAAVTSLAEFGGYVYSGSEDRQILQWRACRLMHARLFSSHCPHDGSVRCLYAEGSTLVSGSDDCTVKVWDIGEGTMRLTGYFHSQSGGVLALCRVGELMWSGDASGQVVRWHLRTCEAVGIHVPHSGRVLSLCRVGHRVYSGSSDGTMGIFDAGSGQLLQHITDQVLGWVVAVECPAKLSRFVVWSASADGAVRCWYQDEYASMTADEVRFNDGSWYASGSTPYREFRAAVGQRTQRLKKQLEAIEHRDNQAMALLRHCSTVFGGGGAGIETQLQSLRDQLTKVEERCRVAEERVAAKRNTVAQMDRDIASTLALLQNARCEINLLLPGEAERVLASMPALTTDDLVAYTPTPALAMLDTASAAPPITTTTSGSSATAPPPPSSSLIHPLPLPTVTVPGSAAVTSASPPAPAVTTSTLGVGGPLTGAPPSLPPSVTVIPLPGSGENAASVTGGALPQPPSSSLSMAAASGLASTDGTAPADGTAAAVAGAGTAPGAAAATAEKRPGAAPPPDDGVTWTNPNVGNYIQRRYYGASPSLRTTDLMKQERRRGRLPQVKVEALQRGPSRPRAPPTVREAKSRSASADAKWATTTTATTTSVIKTSSTKAAA
ncbi:WD domain, G-beta repeat, putative [Leishmania lindenbergi]|uniref:WD domain, G-beta repeat n=1 Tax=Leishmania lindenbergi TaxID=651832 RepID=A0AAW2ZZE4_9TRYP